MTNREEILNELRDLAPELAKVSPKNPYKVPEGYFEGLVPNIPKQEPAKVVKASFSKRITRYAAAAVIAAVIGVGAWLFMKQPGNLNTNTAQTENNIIGDELLQDVAAISDSEIVNYVENIPNSFAIENTNAVAEIKEDYVTLMLANVSDEELEKYVSQHNSIKEIVN